MAVLFFDSSGLVKRYVAETGTAWVIGLLRPSANDIFIANITGIEVASAIAQSFLNFCDKNNSFRLKTNDTTLEIADL